MFDMPEEQRSLLDFPRPSVAVDIAVFTVVDHRLSMVLWRRTGRTRHGVWALPGSFLRERETLNEAVGRTLRDKCAIVGLSPTELRVMDDPDRDERGWVLSVAYFDVVTADVLTAAEHAHTIAIVPIRSSASEGPSIVDMANGQESLPFDHEQIARVAVDRLRHEFTQRPDPVGLLGEEFTILQLRQLHEAIHGQPLQKDTFRRWALPFLVPLERSDGGVVGRPAQLFRHATASC